MLYRPLKDNKTLFEHLAKAEDSTGIWPEEYEPIDPPEEAEFVWEIFWELRNHTKSGFSGPESLSFLELAAWQRIRGFELDPPVIDMILAMDSAYLTEWHKEKPQEKRKPRPPIRGRR